MKIYLVGGAVRDRLLGRPVTERDWVVVGATPAELLAQGFRPVGKDFPVFLHPRSKEEYALARTERKAGRGYTGFVTCFDPSVTLEADLRRRDLTINAMAEDENGRIIDPYGGQRDLAGRWLRHVSAAFAEDPLRVLRVARFAARYAPLGFRVAPETLELMRQISASGELADLVPERVWQELERALGEARPRLFIDLLRACGALGWLLPELDQRLECDGGEPLLEALERVAMLSPQPEVRLALLLHDLDPEQPPGTAAHRAANLRLIDQICDRCRIPNRHRQLARLLAAQSLTAHAALRLDAAALLQLLDSLDAWRRPERFEQFLLAAEADAGRWPALAAESGYPQAAWIRRLLAACRQNDAGQLSGTLSGKAIGERLRQARLATIEQLRETLTDSREHP